MPKPSSKLLSRQLADGIGDVVLQARDVGEAEVQLPGVVILCVFQNFLRIHASSNGGMGTWECLK